MIMAAQCRKLNMDTRYQILLNSKSITLPQLSSFHLSEYFGQTVSCSQLQVKSLLLVSKVFSSVLSNLVKQWSYAATLHCG
jgi:hypothetical protein